MKITPRLIWRSNKGYALIVTLTFLGIMLLLFSTMMFYSVSNAKLTNKNNQYNASEAAAEAATEKVLAQMTHDFEFQNLSNSSIYYSTEFLLTNEQSSWPIHYTFSNPYSNGVPNEIGLEMSPWTTNLQPLDSQYTGLYGLEQQVTISATATPTTGYPVPATVTETVQFAYIPLFQFAIFYNMNLEIAAAATLDIKGPVYSNGGFWSGSDTITFDSTVSAVGIATNTANDPFCSGYSGSGRSTYNVTGQPTSGNDTLTMPVGQSNNPASVEAVVNIPPSPYLLGSGNAYTTNGQLYLANEADLYLTNSPFGTNWGWGNSGNNLPLGSPMALYYSDGSLNPSLTWVTNDFYIVSNYYGTTHQLFTTNYVPVWSNSINGKSYYASGFQTANGFWFTNGITPISYVNYNGYMAGTNYVWYMGYSFLTNVLFYDWREGWNMGKGPPKQVYAVQLDLQKYNIWMTNSGLSPALNASTYGGSNYNYTCNFDKSHPMDSIYIYNAVPLTTKVLPAVRVVNGGMLPTQTAGKGFSLATAMPIYVWGDFNASNSFGSSLSQNSTTYTWPAALMGDAITVLSDSWTDSKSSNSVDYAVSKGSTINCACLEGIVESNPNNTLSESSSKGYSGGVENFLRLLEDWSSKALYYNGSIIVMFPSQYATNCWQQTGYYYSAPIRDWAFDTNFLVGSGLPPLTPKSTGVIRGSWGAN